MKNEHAASTLTEHLARYWADARYDDIPTESVRLAERFLIDTLAAGIARAGHDAARTHVPPIALRAVRASLEVGTGCSILWAQSVTLPAPQAALVNGTASHA